MGHPLSGFAPSTLQGGAPGGRGDPGHRCTRWASFVAIGAAPMHALRAASRILHS